MSSIVKRSLAEGIGTFVLVFCGCGSAILAAKAQGGGIGILGVALAFGLSMLTMAYALGPISGAHLNPAVSVGLAVARRFPSRELLPYIVAQLAGAILASIVLYFVASGASDFSLANGFAANGYGEHSPGGYSLGAGFLAEFFLTAIFLLVILETTRQDAPVGFAPLAIGLTLMLVHLVGIPVTNLSVNPARSTGPALFAGGAALGQLWLFWAAPCFGATAGALLHGVLHGQIRPDVRRPTRPPRPEWEPRIRQERRPS